MQSKRTLLLFRVSDATRSGRPVEGSHDWRRPLFITTSHDLTTPAPVVQSHS